MPLIKYRTDDKKTNEIMVDSNITVSGFMDLINKKSSERVTKSIFRGKILADDDLLRNHITGPDQVLILVTNSKKNCKDIMDLEEVKENKKKKEIESKISSSFLPRVDNNRIRRGFRFTFTVYTTATSKSMLYGDKMDFSLNDHYSKVHKEIKRLISSFHVINFKFKFHLFLSGGVHFKSGTLLDYYVNPDNVAFDNIYVIVTQKGEGLYSYDDTVKNPCSCSTAESKKILSPICKSSISGLTQIASFIGYMFYGGPKSEHILLSLAKVTRFAPLVVNLYRLIENRPLICLNILAITAPLFTLFRSMLPKDVKNENVFEYTLNFLSVFDVITNTEYLKFIEINLKNKDECENMKAFANYCENTKQQDHVIIWTADTINPDFQAVFMNPTFSTIKNIFSTVTTFKPVAPLSLHYIFYPTFVHANDDGSVMLFIKEVHDEEGVVSIIDPLEGNLKEIKIEELAMQVECDKKDDVFTLIDPNKVDQIIFICFDESFSMKWKLEGGNPHHNERTRSVLASEFLKALVKQSYALRVSSFYGLISFSSEVKIVQKLTAMTSEFVQSLEEINPHGKTLLYDAIDTAKRQICSLVKDKKGNSRYPNSRLRIIVITDGADNKSEKPPEELINSLIENEIVVDTVLVSLVDKSAGCCAISKLTGGLCFMPKSFEDGIQIFEQEAFLNIKMRHMNPLPYKEITKEIFDKETKIVEQKNVYDSYAPNQMIINAKSNVSLATPMYMSYISMKMIIKTYRTMRSFIELNIIAQNPSDQYVVYSLFSTPEEWRIFIKGPKDTEFSNKWLNLYMVIPPNYPTDPPRFRFLTIPFHPNVSSEGTVVFRLNDRDYTSTLGIDSIIIGIIELLKNPDKNYPINRKAMELYNSNKKEYLRMQKKGETGCDDYKTYLQDTKIYSQIPKNVVVPTEDRGKSNLISLTGDMINKAVLGDTNIIDHCLLDINDYEIVKHLGSGSYGDVFLVRDKTTHFEFAAKVPKNVCFDANGKVFEAINYIKEVNVMSIFNHGAIAKLYGYCLKDFESNDKCVVIMENVPNGDLQKVINIDGNGGSIDGWDQTQKLINLYGIASGMAYSVSYGITHCDLKPENILMTMNLRPKITDFDSARIESDENTQGFNMTGQEIYSPLFSSPEVIECDDDYTKYAEKSDVYSYSLIAYEIITGRIPFQKMKQFELFRAVVKGERPNIPRSVPSHYRHLLTECWEGDPEKRPTFKEIVDVLKSDIFVNDDDIDKKRFFEYVQYLDNYKDSVTESKFIRPKSEADKKKKKEKDEEENDSKNQDEVLNHSHRIKILKLNKFNKKDFLGAGKYSQVFRVEHIKTGDIFAAKISNNRVSKKISKSILSEVNIMMSLDHPAILKFIGYSPVNFENEPKPTIVTEFLSNGSLQNVINDPSKYPLWNDTTRLIIISGIIAGMAYLHENSILHNDLKPSNILLDDDLHPKIADFGLSQTSKNDDNDNDNDDDESSSKSSNVKGTPSYIAPEIWNNQDYSNASDVYAFGILLYEIVFLKKAFAKLKPLKIGKKVTNKERPQFPSVSEASACCFMELIKRCWADKPSDRPTFKELSMELRKKKYLSKNVDLDEYKKYLKFILNFEKQSAK
ncbi:hypothetical protein M9Y10_011071 [Tritrichomonas musculus]|uniref:Uncharacterized protein n=1 Tax=Tritrichomonas musculus TaxID=1915356 RepID=A0ABR2IMN2_9EUKA